MATSTRQDDQHTSKFAAVLRAPSSSSTPPPPVRNRRRIPRWLVITGVSVALLGLTAGTLKSTLLGTSKVTTGVLTEKVRRSDLIVSIAEDGNVESAHNIDIKCGVQGGATILWLIKDGTLVSKGDELVRLDSSIIEEKVSQERILYEKARATMIDAEKLFESSKIAVEEYEQGMYVQTLKDLEAKATVAKENLESAKNLSTFTDRMARQGYVTPLQRDAQHFAVQRAQLDLDVANTAIEVLKKYTAPKTLVGLKSTRDSAEAKAASERAAFELEEDRLKRLEAQLKECLIIAPDDGMVVYANDEAMRRRGSSQLSMVEEGAMVKERQSLIKLPDLTHMQVKCTVHESKIDQLQRGMRARISIQGNEYQGIVTNVSNQPEPSDWFSGNVKEYAATVAIESDPRGLRPGMTAAVEILVANLPNVLSVPVQAVVEKGGKFYCWVNTFSGPEKRPVVLGLNDNTRIEIKDGLNEGDEVLLNPRATVEEAREEEHGEEKVDVKKRFGGDKPAALPNASAGAPSGGDRSKGGGRPTLDFKATDKNSDGKITEDEAPDWLKGDVFKRLDSNSDGGVTAAELAAARQRMQQRAGGGGGPGGQGGAPGGGQ